MHFRGPASNMRRPRILRGMEVERRKGFPSETHVKRGDRVVGGTKELIEKLGRNDPCPAPFF